MSDDETFKVERWDIIKSEFINDDSKKIDISYIKFLYFNVNRNESICKFYTILENMDKSKNIESGVFEFTLIYASSNNSIMELLPAIYYDKINELVNNLEKDNYLMNKTLKNALNFNIDPRTLAFLRPQDIHPERWGTIIKKNVLRDEKKNNMATNDLYECEKCGKNKCTVVELQIRSADEPTTKIITCRECYHVEQRE